MQILKQGSRNSTNTAGHFKAGAICVEHFDLRKSILTPREAFWPERIFSLGKICRDYLVATHTQVQKRQMSKHCKEGTDEGKEQGAGGRRVQQTLQGGEAAFLWIILPYFCFKSVLLFISFKSRVLWFKPFLSWFMPSSPLALLIAPAHMVSCCFIRSISGSDPALFLSWHLVVGNVNKPLCIMRCSQRSAAASTL